LDNRRTRSDLIETYKILTLSFTNKKIKNNDSHPLNHDVLYINLLLTYNIHSPNSKHSAESLCREYISLRENYFGYPLGDYCTFDTELVSKIIFDLKCGKAPDINGLTAEHLIRAHPSLPVILK